jgi:hypothetical protein
MTGEAHDVGQAFTPSAALTAAPARARAAAGPAALARPRFPRWLRAGLGYLALSAGLWWPAWSSHPTAALTCQCGDPAAFVSNLAWPAYALTHGHSLLLTGMVHVPAGMSMLDNTSVLAIGVLLAPVTWLFGPIATMTVALTAAPALSALSAYGCLRRALDVSRPAAFLAGLLFGFSPFVLRNEAVGHLQVTFLGLVPVIFWCCYELAVAQRGRWWRWGVLLGLAITAQFFVGLEILTITAVLTGLGLLLALAASLRSRGKHGPGALRARLPFACGGFALGGVLAGLLLSYPLWYALAGPAHINGADWQDLTSNGLGRVLFPLALTAGQQHALPKIGYPGAPGLASGYLGLVALAIVLTAAVVVRRPLAVLCAVLLAIATWLSLGAAHMPLTAGGEPSWLPLPWHLVSKLLLLDNVSPANFSALAAGCVAIAAALLTDALGRAWSQQRLPGLVLISGMWAVLGLSWLVAWPLPFAVQQVSTPAWVAHVPAGAVVLSYPFPSSYQDQALVWQAASGFRFALVGGRGIVPGQAGHADHGLTPGTPAGLMSALSTSYAPHSMLSLPPQPDAAAISAFRAALRRWGVTTVVMSGGGRAPSYARQWLTTAIGAPPSHEYGVWIWTSVSRPAG